MEVDWPRVSKVTENPNSKIKLEIRNPKLETNSNIEIELHSLEFEFRTCFGFRISDFEFCITTLASICLSVSRARPDPLAGGVRCRV